MHAADHFTHACSGPLHSCMQRTTSHMHACSCSWTLYRQCGPSPLNSSSPHQMDSRTMPTSLMHAADHLTHACSGPPHTCMQRTTSRIHAVDHLTHACSGPPHTCMLQTTSHMHAADHLTHACSGPPYACMQRTTSRMRAADRLTHACSGPPHTCMQRTT